MNNALPPSACTEEIPPLKTGGKALIIRSKVRVFILYCAGFRSASARNPVSDDCTIFFRIDTGIKNRSAETGQGCAFFVRRRRSLDRFLSTKLPRKRMPSEVYRLADQAAYGLAKRFTLGRMSMNDSLEHFRRAPHFYGENRFVYQ